MPIQHAVLSLLTGGPSYGYELRAAFEKAVGPQWGGLNIGHLYQVLERLSRDGQVSSTTVPQQDRPDRRVYQLTEAGRTELKQWLGQPAERSGGHRDDLVLKLMAASREGESCVRGVISRQRQHELGRLKGLDQLAREHREEPTVALLVQAAILHTRADLALLDQADDEVVALTSQAQVMHADTLEAPEARPIEDSGRPA